MSYIFHHDHIDNLLEHFSDDLGQYLPAYRNHIYRMFNLIGLLSETELSNDQLEKFSVAAAFHDIGIWTRNTLDYLEPSVQLALQYLVSIHKEQYVEEVKAMIRWHHKITAYNGQFETNVNLFRKADWIDVTRGLLHFGVERKEIVKLYGAFPAAGFHYFLLKRGSGYAVRHPLRPFPMFKR